MVKGITEQYGDLKYYRKYDKDRKKKIRDEKLKFLSLGNPKYKKAIQRNIKNLNVKKHCTQNHDTSSGKNLAQTNAPKLKKMTTMLNNKPLGLRNEKNNTALEVQKLLNPKIRKSEQPRNI